MPALHQKRCQQRKIRKSPAKKRVSGINSLFRAKEKTESRKNKSKKQTLKQASCNLKPVIMSESPRKNIPKIHKKKRKSRNSLKADQVNLTENACLINTDLINCKKVIEKKTHKEVRRSLRLSGHSPSPKERGENIPKIPEDKRKTRSSLKAAQVNFTKNEVSVKNYSLINCRKVIEKKNHKEVRRSLRLSEPSPSPKERGGNKKLCASDLKPSNESGRSIIKKSSRQVTTSSSEPVLTPNPEKGILISQHSGRNKSARSELRTQNRDIIVDTPASKSLTVTPAPRKATRISRSSENRKSERLSKEPNRSKVNYSEVSLNTSSFESLLETPHPEKSSDKRKSSRSLGSSPLRTLNEELTSNPDSLLNKSSKSCKSVEPFSSKSPIRKQNRPKVSNKDDSTVLPKKGKEKRKVGRPRKKPLSNETENLPLDILATPAFKPARGRSLPKTYLSEFDSKSSKRKLNASDSAVQVASEELQDAKKRKKSADFPKLPTKGTLKRKRWLLNNLTEKNGNYEDDIFENQDLDHYKPAFHFGDESDGSSINIATPKFDCILSPALPKKTPPFKDCISPTEFMQARKTAEEYIYRRNKKRKSGDKPSSGKKTNVKEKSTVQDIPEKKKLDFEETVNKLIAVQKNLEIEAEVDDEEEDSYFSDSSN